MFNLLIMMTIFMSVVFNFSVYSYFLVDNNFIWGTRITPREEIQNTDWYKEIAESSDDECTVVSTTVQEWYNGVPLYDTSTLNDKSSADSNIDSDDSSFPHYIVLMEDLFREPLSPLKVRTSTLSESRTLNEPVTSNDESIADCSIDSDDSSLPHYRVLMEDLFRKPLSPLKVRTSIFNETRTLREPEKIMKQHMEPENLRSMYPKESGIKHQLIKIDISPRKKNRRQHQSSTSSSDMRRPRQSSSSFSDMRRTQHSSSSSGDIRCPHQTSSSSSDMRRPHRSSSLKLRTSALSKTMREPEKIMKQHMQPEKLKSMYPKESEIKYRLIKIDVSPHKKNRSIHNQSSLPSSGNRKRKFHKVLPVLQKAKKGDLIMIGYLLTYLISIAVLIRGLADNELELRQKVYGNIVRLSRHKDIKLDYNVAGQAIEQIDVLQYECNIVRCINGFLNA